MPPAPSRSSVFSLPPPSPFFTNIFWAPTLGCSAFLILGFFLVEVVYPASSRALPSLTDSLRNAGHVPLFYSESALLACN
eukprot:5170112-Pleurochrysis_carterae.AAC.1